MDAFLLALLLALALDQGSATQRIAARFGDEEAPLPFTLSLALAILANAVVSAVFGAVIAALLAPNARLLFLAMALGLGGGGLIVGALRPSAAPRDRGDRGARAVIRFALRRAGENAAFATTGIAAFTAAPLLAGGGAVLGGWAALILPLSLGHKIVGHGAMRAFQGVAGLVIFCAALFCAASAFNLL